MNTPQHKNIRAKLQRPILLVGLMGAGKSHMGRSLSRALDIPLHDSDKVIEEKAGRSISDIFEEFGEEKFRSAEKNTIIELIEDNPSIIATGGGAVIDSQTLSIMLEKGIVIWLKADIETLWARVQKTSHRPLLQAESPKLILENLLKERTQFYEQAHITFDTTPYKDEKSGDIALKDMLETLEGYLNTQD